MDKLKQWVTLTALASLVVLAAGWFLLVSPKKSEAADLQAQAAGQVAANSVVQTQLQVLQAQAKELPKKQADLARISTEIPDNPSLPALIRALTSASSAAGVELVSVTPGPAVADVPVAAAVAVADPANPAASAAPAVGAAGLLAAIPIDLNVVGGYFQIAQFMANLENLPRALMVTNLALVPGASPTAAEGAEAAAEDGSSLVATITGRVFMAAGRPTVTSVVAPAAAAPAN